MSFGTIEIDPPWPERGGGRIKRGSDRHYESPRVADLPRIIIESPAFEPDPRGCACWLWTTVSSLPAGLELLRALGFAYVTHGVWTKPGAPGIGQRMRVCHELLLLGTIGLVPLPAPSARPPSVLLAKRRGHSVKPPEAMRWTASTLPLAPRVSMFARSRRPGWWTWGTFEHDEGARSPDTHVDHRASEPETWLCPPLPWSPPR